MAQPNVTAPESFDAQTWAGLVAMVVIASFHLIFGRMLAPLVSPFVSAFFVLAIATLEIGLYLAWNRSIQWRILAKHRWFFIAIGFLIAGSTVMNYMSVTLIDAGTASLLSRFSTVVTLALSYFWLKESLSGRELFGALLCMIGAVLISFQPGDVFRSGSLLVIGGLTFYSLHIAIVKRYGDNIEFGNFFFFRVGLTAFFLLIFMVFSGNLTLPTGAQTWGILIVAGTIDVVISRILYYWVLRQMRLGIHTIALTITPVLTILWSIPLFRRAAHATNVYWRRDCDRRHHDGRYDPAKTGSGKGVRESLMLREERFLSGDTDLNVAYGEKNGPTLVMVNGLTGRWQNYIPIIPAIAPHFELIAPDLRGHGGSQNRPGQYRLDDYVGDIVALIQSLERPVLLMGHSLGGMVVLRLTARYPELVQKLVVIDPAMIGANPRTFDDGQGKTYFQLLYKLWTEAQSEAELAASLRAHNILVTSTYEERAEILFQTDPDTVKALFEKRSIHGHDYHSDLRALTCPVLFVRADKDLWSAMSNQDAADVKRLVPQVTFADMPGAGHSVYVDQPEIFCQHLLNFLK